MSHELTKAVSETLPETSLKTAARFALHLLAGAAQTDCPIAWPSHEWLAVRIGCATGYMGPCVRQLVDDGRVSVWRKSGGASLYLVHPEGIDALAPIDGKAVHRRLSRTTFPVREVIEWMAGLGIVRGRQGDTPQLSWGVPLDGHPPTQLDGHPPTQLDPPPNSVVQTPQLSWTESKENRNRNYGAAKSAQTLAAKSTAEAVKKLRSEARAFRKIGKFSLAEAREKEADSREARTQASQPGASDGRKAGGR